MKTLMKFASAALVAAGLCLAPHAGAMCLDPPGDVKGDGVVTVSDVQCTMLVLMWDMTGGQVPACATLGPEAADLDCDGQVLVTDVLLDSMLAVKLPLGWMMDALGDGLVDACQEIGGPHCCGNQTPEACTEWQLCGAFTDTGLDDIDAYWMDGCAVPDLSSVLFRCYNPAQGRWHAFQTELATCVGGYDAMLFDCHCEDAAGRANGCAWDVTQGTLMHTLGSFEGDLFVSHAGTVEDPSHDLGKLFVDIDCAGLHGGCMWLLDEPDAIVIRADRDNAREGTTCGAFPASGAGDMYEVWVR